MRDRAEDSGVESKPIRSQLQAIGATGTFWMGKMTCQRSGLENNSAIQTLCVLVSSQVNSKFLNQRNYALFPLGQHMWYPTKLTATVLFYFFLFHWMAESVSLCLCYYKVFLFNYINIIHYWCSSDSGSIWIQTPGLPINVVWNCIICMNFNGLQRLLDTLRFLTFDILL